MADWIIESVIVWSGVVGRGMIRPRQTAGSAASSSGRAGASRSWRMYQSVLASAMQTTVTSRRMPATSWPHQSGNVSLSPTVNRIPYGGTLLSRS